MIGPRKKKMPDKNMCTGCDVVISKELGGTRLYPKKRIVNYCKHPNLETQVSFIKGFPATPKWCPELAQKSQMTWPDGEEFDYTPGGQDGL